MSPPATLTKADKASHIVSFQQEEGGESSFAVYVGKAGAKAWLLVPSLPDARRKVADVNSVQSVRSLLLHAPPALSPRLRPPPISNRSPCVTARR